MFTLLYIARLYCTHWQGRNDGTDEAIAVPDAHDGNANGNHYFDDMGDSANIAQVI